MDPNPNRRPQNPFDLFRNDPFLNNRDLDPFNTPFFQNSPLFRQRVQMPSTFRSDFQSNIPLRDDSEEDDDERQMQEAIRRSRQEAESKNSNQQSSRQPLIEEPSSDTEFERNRILAQVERDFPAAGHSPAHTPINVTSQYGSRDVVMVDSEDDDEQLKAAVLMSEQEENERQLKQRQEQIRIQQQIELENLEKRQREEQQRQQREQEEESRRRARLSQQQQQPQQQQRQQEEEKTMKLLQEHSDAELAAALQASMRDDPTSPRNEQRERSSTSSSTTTRLRSISPPPRRSSNRFAAPLYENPIISDRREQRSFASNQENETTPEEWEQIRNAMEMSAIEEESRKEEKEREEEEKLIRKQQRKSQRNQQTQATTTTLNDDYVDMTYERPVTTIDLTNSPSPIPPSLRVPSPVYFNQPQPQRATPTTSNQTTQNTSSTTTTATTSTSTNNNRPSSRQSYQSNTNSSRNSSRNPTPPFIDVDAGEAEMLRQQQDFEYEEGLRKDREKEELERYEREHKQREEELERKRKEDAEQKEKLLEQAKKMKEQTAQQQLEASVQNAISRLPIEPAKGTDTADIQITSKDGKIRRRFKGTDTIQTLYDLVESKRLEWKSVPSNFTLSTTFNPQKFTNKSQTLKDAGLLPNAALVVTD